MSFHRETRSFTAHWSRLSFPQVFEPKPIVVQGRQIGDPRYSCLIVLHDPMVAPLQALEEELIRLSWPEGIPQGITLQRAVRRGEQVRPGDPNLAGKWVLSANAKPDSPPHIVERGPDGTLFPVTDRAKVYSGVEAHAGVGLYTTQLKITEPQINVGLNGLELTGRKFGRFDNKQTAEQMFGATSDNAPPPPPAPEGSPPGMAPVTGAPPQQVPQGGMPTDPYSQWD